MPRRKPPRSRSPPRSVLPWSCRAGLNPRRRRRSSAAKPRMSNAAASTLVLAAERRSAETPVEQAVQQHGLRHPVHQPRRRHRTASKSRRRIDGAEDFFVTHNEVMTGKTRTALPPRAREVDPRGPAARRSSLPREPFRRQSTWRLRRHRPPRLEQDWAQGRGTVRTDDDRLE